MSHPKTRYFFDTEFHEDGTTIDLISIGIVCEDGREYYAVSRDFNVVRALNHDWLRQNVLPHLPWKDWDGSKPLTYAAAEPDDSGVWKHTEQIAKDIVKFVNPEVSGRPEFWAYFADYDWVALCQLYGTMMQLPRDWPLFCMDIKQTSRHLGNVRLPKQDESKEHNALNDARWNYYAWLYLREESLQLGYPPLFWGE